MSGFWFSGCQKAASGDGKLSIGDLQKHGACIENKILVVSCCFFWEIKYYHQLFPCVERHFFGIRGRRKESDLTITF